MLNKFMNIISKRNLPFASRDLQYFTTVAHELRTPLANIAGYTELLIGEDKELSPQQLRSLQAIGRNQRYLSETVEKILALYQRPVSRPCTFSPRTLIEEVVAEELTYSGGGPEISLEIDESIPPLAKLDPEIFEQVALHLIDNAIKFTPEERKPHITVQLAADQSSLILRVFDNGIGILEMERNRIFEPFYQCESSMSRRFGGVGLGLSLVRQLLDEIGGDILVDSVFGVGSTFTAILPYVQATNPLNLKVRTAPCLIGKKVLIVDDCEDILDLLEVNLNRIGVGTFRATNGKEAIDFMTSGESHPVDAIILDMQMPILTGYQCAHLLRQRGIQIPILALTAHSYEFDRETCFSSGVDRYLTKPIDWELLRSELSDSIAEPHIEHSSATNSLN